MSDVLNVIPEDDGYTEDCYFAAMPGVHSEVRFKYRPMLYAERLAVSDEMGRKKPADASLLAAQAVGKFVKSWSLSQPKTVATIARLKPSLLQRMYMVVCGYDGGDQDPESKPTEAQANRDIDAVLGGITPGQAREEADAGNSSAG